MHAPSVNPDDKRIFDKLSTLEIEKAVILRDGKPNFMLLEFNKYEEMMIEYQKLKEKDCNLKQVIFENNLEFD